MTFKWCVLSVVSGLLMAGNVQSQEVDSALRSSEVLEVRRSLQQYDLKGDKTITVLKKLARMAGKTPKRTSQLDRDLAVDDNEAFEQSLPSNEKAPPNPREEARFLRYAVGADLYLIAKQHNLNKLVTRTAKAFNTNNETLVSVLQQALRSFTKAPYAAPASALVSALSDNQTARRPTGLRDGSLFVKAATRAIQSADIIGSLSALVPDPCVGEQPCPRLYRTYDTRGRKATSAIFEAYHAHQKLKKALAEGDPFATAVRADLSNAEAAFSNFSMSPSPKWTRQLRELSDVVTNTNVNGFVLAVTGTAVGFGYTPQIRITDKGPELHTPEPKLTDGNAMRLETEVQTFPRPIDALVDAIKKAKPSPRSDVSLLVTPELPAYMVTRVVLSANKAGLKVTRITGADRDGIVKTAKVRFRRDSEDGARRGRVYVWVKLGGYSVYGNRGKSKITRFNSDELAQAVATKTKNAGLIKYMSTVPVRELVRGASILNAAHEQVTVLIP